MKKTLNILFLLFIINFAIAQTQDCCENICDNMTIYGDADNNIPLRIKHYDDFIYLTGTTNISDQSFATFSKLDITGQVIWQYRFDVQSIFYDFVKIGSEFLLVGSTIPYLIGGNPVDTQSILARIDDNGNPIYIRSYQNSGREAFYRILKHPNPPNANAPYYISAFENVDGAPSFNDKVHLHNLDVVGNIVWSVEYNTSQFDEQFYRDIAPTNDGHLMLLGNYLPANRGVVLKVDGTNGQVLSAKEASDNVIYNGVRELSDGNIVVSGFFLGTPRESLLSLFDSNLNFLSSTRLNNGGVLNITSIDTDTDDNIYGAGELNNGQPVIIKANTVGNQFNIVAAKYFTDGESTFYDATIHVDGTNLYYADGRANNPLSPGGQDIASGYFNTALSDDCLVDAEIVNNNVNYTFTNSDITATNFTISNPTNTINLVPLNYSSQQFCPNPDCPEPPSPDIVPTLSEWGLIMLGLFVLIIGIIAIKREEEVLEVN